MASLDAYSDRKGMAMGKISISLDDQKLVILKQAIQDGLNSGFSEKTIDDAWDEAQAPKHEYLSPPLISSCSF